MDGVEKGTRLLERGQAGMICRTINRVIWGDAFRRATERYGPDYWQAGWAQDALLPWDFPRALCNPRPKQSFPAGLDARPWWRDGGVRGPRSPPSCCGNGAMEGEIRCRRALHACMMHRGILSRGLCCLLMRSGVPVKRVEGQDRVGATDQHVEVCRRTDVQCRMDPARVDHGSHGDEV